MAELTIRLVSGSFALGFQLAAPFLVFGFAVNAAFGVLARLMPQLQFFFVAMPINILVGFCCCHVARLDDDTVSELLLRPDGAFSNPWLTIATHHNKPKNRHKNGSMRRANTAMS